MANGSSAYGPLGGTARSGQPLVAEGADAGGPRVVPVAEQGEAAGGGDRQVDLVPAQRGEAVV